MARKSDRPSTRTPRAIIKDFLGESTATSGEEDESFRSPSTDAGVTRYSLNYSSAKGNKTAKPAKKEAPKNISQKKKNERGASNTQRESTDDEISDVDVAPIRSSPRKTGTESPKKLVKGVSRRKSSTYQQREDTSTDEEESDIDVENNEISSRENQLRNESQQSRRTSPRKHVSPTPGPSRMVPTAKPSKNAHKSIPKRKHISNNTNIPKVYKEIISLQQSTTLQMRKLPFSRVIREILMTHDKDGMRITPEALMALQESAEVYLTILFQDANLCTLHRDRKTLHPKDIRLVRNLRGVSDPGN